MAYQSLLGYAKDGSAEVVALSKGSSMDTINTWALGAYRNLKFYSPTTGDLNTWLQSNAVKMPLEGTWVFNSTISVDSSASFHVNFSCNGKTYARMAYNSSNVFCYYTIRDASTEVYSSSSWTNTAYRTITFTSPVQYEGNEEFVRWFVDNAAPPPSDLMPGNYQFNIKLTDNPFSTDTSVAVSFSSYSNVSSDPEYLDYDTIQFENGAGVCIDWKHVGNSYAYAVYQWSYDGDTLNKWDDYAHRTITLKEPIKYIDNPEFYEWFSENTIAISKVLPAGAYLMKDNNDINVKGYNGKDLEGIIKFESNNKKYSVMYLLYTPNVLSYSTTYACSSSTWQNQNYRIVKTFYDQPVTEDFYNWFMANIIVNPEDLSGAYVLNNPVTSYDYLVRYYGDGKYLISADYTAVAVGMDLITCKGFVVERYDVNNAMYFYTTDKTEHLYLGYGSLSANYPATITFTTPFKYSTDPEFYLWFINNATKQS